MLPGASRRLQVPDVLRLSLKETRYVWGGTLVVLAVFVRLLFSQVAHVVTLSYCYVAPLFARGSLGTGLIKLFLLGLTEVLII